ncbi:MAG: dihydropteroate synthase [Bacteroidota bacterium]
MLHPQTLINCAGQLLDLSRPRVMGILNLTPDSFYDGGRYDSEQRAMAQVERMLSEGAAIIDVGGMSSRPGAKVIDTQEELQRVLPTIKAIKQHFPQAIISIDTIRGEVARQAVEAGAAIVNDISAGSLDPMLLPTVADLGVPYILMHLQGRPETMQDNPQYQDVVLEVLDFFCQKIAELRQLGIGDILLDPGFGFGKKLEHNYELLTRMNVFQIPGLPVLAGVSRKSMIYKYLKVKPEEALNGTSALHMIALQQGARILRVHDVKAAIEVVQLWEMCAAVGENCGEDVKLQKK